MTKTMKVMPYKSFNITENIHKEADKLEALIMYGLSEVFAHDSGKEFLKGTVHSFTHSCNYMLNSATTVLAEVLWPFFLPFLFLLIHFVIW